MSTEHTSLTGGLGRPAIRWLAIVGVVVLTPMAAHAAWDYIGVRRLVREIEAIKARGEPVNQAQAGRGHRQLSAEEKKGSGYYLAAAALAGELTSTVHYKSLPSWHEWLAGATASAPDLNALSRDLGIVVESGAEALRLAEIGNALPFNGFAPGTEYNYRASQLGDVSRLFSARTLYLSLSKRGDEAAASALSALKYRRPLNDLPWFWRGSHEIPSVLSLSPPSPDSLERLQAALEAEESAFSVEDELADERAVLIDAIWRRYYGIDPESPHARSLPIRSVPETLWRPLFTHHVVSILRQWAELMEAARRPWPEKSKAMAAVLEKYEQDDRPPRYPFLAPGGLMGAAFWHSGIGGRGNVGIFVTDRCTRVAVAVERFRRDNGGELPDNLEQLVPKYLQEVPVDPAGGGPLRYVRDATSYTIYSVGPDGADNGGDLSSELRAVIERGWGRREIRGRDEGVRVRGHGGGGGNGERQNTEARRNGDVRRAISKDRDWRESFTQPRPAGPA